jgi:hypothetical protein
MIEKGLTPDLPLQKNTGGSILLKIGIIIIGLSIGLVIIYILHEMQIIHGGMMPIAILGICGGIAMIIANYTDNKK